MGRVLRPLPPRRPPRGRPRRAPALARRPGSRVGALRPATGRDRTDRHFILAFPPFFLLYHPLAAPPLVGALDLGRGARSRPGRRPAAPAGGSAGDARGRASAPPPPGGSRATA